MDTLSHQILDTSSVKSIDLNHNLADCYQWIWFILLRNQPMSYLQEQLDAIEMTVFTKPPQFQLELAWKAQAIEALLDQ